jgi:uncharacterized protein YndB with AHSA1/START domain
VGASPQPSGTLLATGVGRDLIPTRSFSDPIEAIWADLTEPERTVRWFASWSGKGEPGAKISYRMVFEEGAPETEMWIDACEAPHRLAVRTEDEHGAWLLEARLREEGGGTVLELVHHLGDEAGLEYVGPGWEYYLDMLVASRAGQPLPDFDDYYPGQAAYYESLE